MSSLQLIDELINKISVIPNGMHSCKKHSGNKVKNRWIFGYGSLINSKSRCLSSKTPDAYAVRLHNYKRRWNRKEGPTQPWMGIIPLNNYTVNGVIFQVNDETIKAFDKRELKWGYKRKEINIKDIQLLSIQNKNKINLNLSKQNDIIETYELCFLKQQENNPMDINSDKYKNLRKNPSNYIDVCLKGCLEVGGEEFLVEFIRTVYDWRYKWNMDRYSGTRKAWDLNQNECKYMDKMLKKCINEYHHFVPLHLTT